MWLEKTIQQHTTLCGYIAATIYIFINNTVNALSTWTEHNRKGISTTQLWEPFVWEYTSALSLLVLIPMLVVIFQRYPIKTTPPLQQVMIHIVSSLLFSSCHVLLMVGLRHLAYMSMQGNYDFGNYYQEFWYEYRKDVLSYLFIFFIFHSARWVLEPTPAYEQSPATSHQPPTQFLVKKQGEEHVIKVSEIEWYEASGNYVNLHSNGRIYPLRETLSSLSNQLATAQVTRVHRRFAVNNHKIKSVRFVSSGDGVITLKSGAEVNLSRRYKSDFKLALETPKT
ncbi:LytTR family transcriptional regulator [Pseudoalteromonas sp. SMS1]|uniref:LytR/AlgR family response regulator transcription factor n=1 Tax=Pseudoalteromonas sp. SMS1 TaxID=2908894 RepID=UPI001F41951C|nr:LytTR family DNA-binding domain-containing protein [Pseudoalteromonas sp. SMS1]MCF2856229.1 LytTR family transcriptional regulator [Pseudoalteromonas sp. SMS1]